jgi:hypothetical protein
MNDDVHYRREPLLKYGTSEYVLSTAMQSPCVRYRKNWNTPPGLIPWSAHSVIYAWGYI